MASTLRRGLGRPTVPVTRAPDVRRTADAAQQPDHSHCEEAHRGGLGHRRRRALRRSVKDYAKLDEVPKVHHKLGLGSLGYDFDSRNKCPSSLG